MAWLLAQLNLKGLDQVKGLVLFRNCQELPLCKLHPAHLHNNRRQRGPMVHHLLAILHALSYPVGLKEVLARQ